MGKPKAWLRVGESSILGWLLDRLQWAGPTMLVTAPSVDPPPDRERFGAHVVDPPGGLGPLRGVLTALEAAATEVVVTIAVDMPLVQRCHLEWLTESLIRRPACLGVMCRATDRSAANARAPYLAPDVHPGLVSLTRPQSTAVGVADGIEQIEPFPSAFRAGAASVISTRLQAEQRSLRGLCSDPQFQAIAVPDSWDNALWTNLNDVGQLAAFEAAVGANGRNPSK